MVGTCITSCDENRPVCVCFKSLLSGDLIREEN